MKFFRNKLTLSLAALAISTCSLTSASAQGVGFQKGKTYAGPTIGFGIGGGLGFGAAVEHGITDNIGLGLDLGYTSFSEDFFGTASFDYSLFAALVAGSYHFSPNEKFDPFLKLGVGYFNWDATYTVNGKEMETPFGTAAAYASGVGFTGQIGARYELSPLLNGRLTVGYPFYLAAGIDFTFGGEGKRSGSSTSDHSNAGEVAPGSTNAYTLYVGPYVHAKGSINTNPAAGYKTGVAFNSVPDFGATILAPFGKESKIGFQLDLGHSSLAYQLLPEDRDMQSDSTNFTESYRYFTVAPGFNFAGFTIGISFGMPIGASMESERGQSTHPIHGFFASDEKIPDYVDSLASITEVFIGGRIPLVDSPSGKLTFDIQASYTLSGLYDNYKSYQYAYEENSKGQLEAKEDRNPKPVALKMGLSYLFGIGF